MTVRSGKIPGGVYLIQIRHHILDGGDFDSEPTTEPQTRVSPHHAIVTGKLRDAFDDIAFLNQLTDHPGGRTAGQPAQINGSLSVPSALAHATVASS
jgi:hypothetical protein